MTQIIKCEYVSDYKLRILFKEENQERIVDLSSLLRGYVGKYLSNKAFFSNFENKGYYLQWNHEIDITADTIYCLK